MPKDSSYELMVMIARYVDLPTDVWSDPVVADAVVAHLAGDHQAAGVRTRRGEITSRVAAATPEELDTVARCLGIGDHEH